ncbi:MAG TPA: hypothetical protein DEP87_00275 [Candidatus Pacebacteria bacterium]|nr:hypothetical protein [Candidatus Paceibacterota bacterium]
MKLLLFLTKTEINLRFLARLRAELHQIQLATDYRQTEAFLETKAWDLFITDQIFFELQLLKLLELIQTEKLGVQTCLIATDLTLNQKLRLFELGLDELWSVLPPWPELRLRLKILAQKTRLPERAKLLLDGHNSYYLKEGILDWAGQKIKLRPKEAKILECLVRYQYRVLPRAEIMRFAWQYPAETPNPDTLDVYIRRLRLKLPQKGAVIKTYRGFGYRWEPGVSK